MGTNTSGRGFARRLRGHLDEQGIGVRTLARRIDPDNIEGARRRLNQYLAGDRTPRAASRAEIATALGLPADAFDDADDEDEDPANMPVLVATLTREIRKLRQEIAAR